MGKLLFKKRFLYFLPLISLLAFLIFPKYSLANNIENTNLEEMGKYLELNQNDAQNLIDTLRQLFTDKITDLWSSTYATDEEIAVAVILLRVVRIEVLNHLLVEAPLEVIKNLINYSAKIARIFFVEDISVVLDELEKQSVNSAVKYGINALLQKEIKITPGAIKFRYSSYKGYEKEVIFQYIMVYHPLDAKNAAVKIRFYSPNSIEAPDSQKFRVGYSLSVPDIQGNLPPFLVDIDGTVEKTKLNNYNWTKAPSIKIDFPTTVPDIGIRPLTFWEKHLLKPIESTIKEVEIIITRVTGKSFKITENFSNASKIINNFWTTIKLTVSNINPLSLATIVDNPKEIINFETKSDKISKIDPQFYKLEPNELKIKPEMPFKEIQDKLDDIVEEVDLIKQEAIELVKVEPKNNKIQETEKLKEIDELEKDFTQKTSKEKNITGYYYANNSVIGDFSTPSLLKLLPEVLISEIQINNSSSSNYDFIELFNYGTIDLDVSGFQLKKKSSTGNEYSIRVFPENSFISTKDYFLWLNFDYASSGQILGNVASNQTLSSNNSLALLDKNKNIVDSLAWGTSVNPFVEGLPFNQNPTVNQSLGRKWSTATQNYIDTDNNQTDFEIQIPTPKTQNKLPASNSTSELEEPLLVVVINEVGWMGTKANSNDEWIELYNNTQNEINLVNWSLKWSYGTSSHSFTLSTSTGNTIISGHGFFLLERVDDKNISDTPADQIYTGVLKNDGAKIELRNNNGYLIDMIDCSSGWFAGSGSPNYISMERINSTITGNLFNNWANNNLISKNGKDAVGNLVYGTPKNQNSVSKIETKISALPFEDFSEIIITSNGSPYLVSETLNVPKDKTLIIKEGTTLKFYEGKGLNIEGTLSARGQEDKNIVFTSLLPPDNSDIWWNKIFFASSSINSILEYCEISNARGEPEYTALIIDSSFVELKNITLQDIAQKGLEIINSSSTIDNLIVKNINGTGMTIYGGSPEIKNSKFDQSFSMAPGILIENGSKAKIIGNYIEGSRYSQGPLVIINSFPLIKDNAGTSTNSFNGIFVFGEITQDWKLYKNENFPYYLYLTKTLENTLLEFDSGTIVNVGNILEINGTLKSEGLENDKIIIFGCSNEGCYKGQIYFTPQSKNSLFKNTLILKGYSSGAIHVLDSNVNFQNTEFKDNNIALLLENSSSTIFNCSFLENPAISIQIDSGTSLIKNSNFSNGNVAILIKGGESKIENNYFENFFYQTGTIFGENTNSTFSGNFGQNNQSNKISLLDTASSTWTYIDL